MVIKMSISEKVAYIKGMAEGMKIDPETNEGKLTLAILDVLKDVAEEIEDISDSLDEIDEELDEMADIVGSMEEELYGGYDDEFGLDGDELYEITCRKCNHTVAIDMSMLDEGAAFNCPNCGEKIEMGIDFIDGDCDDCDDNE